MSSSSPAEVSSPLASPDEQAPAADDVVVTTSLRKVYATGRVAVEELNLAVHRGEIFGLLGPNGAGKSTTVGMLTTRIIPSSGRAVVNGIDVVADPARAIAGSRGRIPGQHAGARAQRVGEPLLPRSVLRTGRPGGSLGVGRAAGALPVG